MIYEDKVSMNSDYWVMIRIFGVVREDEADQIGRDERRSNQIIENACRVSALKCDLREMEIFITVLKYSKGEKI